MSGLLRIWTMRTAGLTEADTAPWLDLLDDDERARAARFVFERHRMTFIAAHVLARCALSRVIPSHAPDQWRFVAGEHGKPVAWAPVSRDRNNQPPPIADEPNGSLPEGLPATALPANMRRTTVRPAAVPSGGILFARSSGGVSPAGASQGGVPVNYQPAAVTFNLSHTDGLVGLATLSIPGQQLGFDVEPLGRPVNLDVADRFFRPEETAWLRELPETGRAEGFLRLWTLKEAFIKATGEGLARDLASFWFRIPEATISFVAPGETATAEVDATAHSQDDPSEWQFEQQIVDGTHLAAFGLHHPAARHASVQWSQVSPTMLGDGGQELPDD